MPQVSDELVKSTVEGLELVHGFLLEMEETVKKAVEDLKKVREEISQVNSPETTKVLDGVIRDLEELAQDEGEE